MKTKTIALLTMIAFTSFCNELSIDAGESAPLQTLQTQTQNFIADLKKEAYNKTNKLAQSLANTIKFIESDADQLAFTTGIVEGNYNARGLSGEIGAYQIMPETWNRYCIRYFKEVLEPTKENQDLIVVTVMEDLINRGYSIEQIAAIWNSGTHKNWETKIGVNSYGAYYNVPAYVHAFKAIHNNLSKVNLA
jgi:hypothetical protein